MQEPLVSICCLVYNHEPYLRQCFDGFVMQQTNFPIEVLVHDDASTDNSASIIREYTYKYPDLFKPIYQTENQYSKGVGVTRVYQFPRAKGKYIAMCEGDDYWIDPLKLQKQVDFLENNPAYGLVHTGYKTSKGNVYKNQKFNKNGNYLKDFLIGRKIIATLTILFSKKIYNQTPKFTIQEKFKVGDLPLRIELAKTSKIKYLNDVTAVYRILDKSASHSPNIEEVINFQKKTLLIRLFYIRQYQLQKLRKKSFKTFYSVVIKSAHEKKDLYYSNLYFRKLCSIGMPSLKTFVYYLGTKYAIFDNLIHFIKTK